MQLTLAQLFGEGASQTSANLTIKKSALRGLTSSQNNRAEQLLAAILLRSVENFQGTVTSETGEPLTSETGESVTYNNSNLYESLTLEQWRTVLTGSHINPSC